MTANPRHSPQVVVITDHGGQKTNDRWSHVHIQAQLTDATPQQVAHIRSLVGQIVDVMKE